MKKNKSNKKENAPLITRKQAIKKASLTALTATTMLLLTSQAKAQGSVPTSPGTGWPT